MKLILASVFTLISFTIFAQQNRFIYIQSDNQQAFYVKLDKKVMSSTASGYIIIPKLKDSTYNLALGFPRNEWPEQYISCKVGSSDAGYLLKNFAEKGWGLFNFQTMELLMAEAKPRVDSNNSIASIVVKKDDAFANALSTVVNDPGIVTTTATDENKTDSTKNPALKKTVAKKPVNVNAKSKTRTATTKSKISKLADKKGTDSVTMVYIDQVKGKADTIDVVMPASTDTTVSLPAENIARAPLLVKADTKKSKTIKPKQENNKTKKKGKEKQANIAKAETRIMPELKDSIIIIPAEKKVDEVITDTVSAKPVIEIEKPIIAVPEKAIDSVKEIPKNIDPPVIVKPVVVEKVEKPIIVEKPVEKTVTTTNSNAVYVKSNCKVYADDDEYLNLRIKMEKNKKNETEMLYLAHKLFEKRCFNTRQIQRLGLLFSNDAGKYKLFDDAYQYTYDLDKFPSLESELTDEYYKKRFRAMLR